MLRTVSRWQPPLHALIDTGALVTGLSNLQVAAALLSYGLPHVAGCVYLDHEVRKRTHPNPDPNPNPNPYPIPHPHPNPNPNPNP